MTRMPEIEYTALGGEREDAGIVVYALSTCGFCKRALAFLDANGFPYRYVYVDFLPLETKNAVKQALQERFGEHVAFPFAVTGDGAHLVGFIEADWRKTLGVKKA